MRECARPPLSSLSLSHTRFGCSLAIHVATTTRLDNVEEEDKTTSSKKKDENRSKYARVSPLAE